MTENQRPELSINKQDWFMPALLNDATVSDSLEAVHADLAKRIQFVESLNTALCSARGGVDSISSLSVSLSLFEHSLGTRLAMLYADKPAAWQREVTPQSLGPFAGSILREPVFCPHGAVDIAALRTGLKECWKQSSKSAPKGSEGNCLWQKLLEGNFAWNSIATLKAPYSNLRLDELPEHLPEYLHSPILDGYLSNVRRELKSARKKLDQCYQLLMNRSEEVWAYQEKQRRVASSGFHKNHEAERMRSEFRKRRQSARARISLTAPVRDALTVMGFDEFPEKTELKRRYLTLAKEHHPDAASGCEDSFKRLSHAYNYLTERLRPLRP